MSAYSDEIKNRTEQALSKESKLKGEIELLGNSSRRERQHAAAVIRQIALADAKLLEAYAEDIVAALDHPEAQTRWELLEALSLLVELDARACGKALPEAENSLFDEESGPLRLAAMRFLCKYGATTSVRSEKVWPLIDEAIQCYHGDVEFNEMLAALLDFSTGKLADDVKTAFSERMSFDAANGKGVLQRKAQQIEENLK